MIQYYIKESKNQPYSIYDDFWNMSKGIEFPFEKYGIEIKTDKPTIEESEKIIRELVKRGLDENSASLVIARHFGSSGETYE